MLIRICGKCRYNTFKRVGGIWDFNTIEVALWDAGAIYVFSSRNNIHHNYGEDLRGGVGYLQSPRSQGPGGDPYYFSVEGSIVC